MKRIFTYSLLALALGYASPAFADDNAMVSAFSFSVDEAAIESKITFNVSAINGTDIQVDWGNGELNDYKIADYDGEGWVFSEIAGTIAGKTITVYASDPAIINYLDLSKDLSDDADVYIISADFSLLKGVKKLYLGKNKLTSLDVSGMESLATLDALDNQLTKLTLPQSEVLTSINVSNNVNITSGEKNEDAGDNQVLGSKWSNVPNLTTLNVNGNSASKMGLFGSFDISSNKSLKTLNANCCDLSSIDVTQNTALNTFNAQWNRFTTIDLTQMVAKKAAVMLNHNNLKSIKLPDTTEDKMTRLNLSFNAFSFATLPTVNATNFVYSDQQAILNPLNGKNIVDLSAQAKVGETESIFKWTAYFDGSDAPVDLTAEGDNAQYSVTAPGVFQFNLPVDSLSAQITNEVFPNLTLSTTAATSVELLPVMLTMDVTKAENADNLTFGLCDSEGQNIYIDWGDGEFDGPVTVAKLGYDYSPEEITGTVKGDKIQIKGTASTVENLVANAEIDTQAGVATSAVINAIDLSKLTALKKLSLENNALAEIDLSNNKELLNVKMKANKLKAFSAELPELTNLDLSNYGISEKVYGENAVENLDFGKLPAIKTFIGSFTGISYDLSKAENLTSATLIGNGYTDFKPVSASITSLTLNYNNLTTFDGSGLTANGKINIFLTYNKLGEADCLTLPENANNVNISNNAFTFATLPGVKSVNGTLTYAPQSDVEVTANDGVIDLSVQATVGETATVFAWTAGEEAIADTDFSVADGVFTFNKSFSDAVCAMTNAEFPKLTLKTIPVEISANSSAVDEIETADDAEVEYFNLQGIKVSGKEAGIYIRRQGKTTTKVIVK